MTESAIAGRVTDVGGGTVSRAVKPISQPSGPPDSRRFELDALRGFAMLLGVVLHAALAFFPAGWWVQDRTSGWDSPFDELFWAIHGFRMPVFFLLSGFFTALLWRRRGLRALLGHRLRRVGVPLVLGLVTIVPLTAVVGDQAVVSGQVPEERVFAAVFAGDPAAVERLLDGGVDVDLRSEPGGWTLLHAASLTGDTAQLGLLLDRGADPGLTAPASEGETPLGVAFHFGHEAAADLLVSHGAADPLPEGVKWSDIPGWGEGAEGSDIESDPDSPAWSFPADLVDSFFHLWFLWFLVWMVAGFAVVAAIVERSGRPKRAGRRWPGWVMWSMVPLTLVPQLARGEGGTVPLFGPETSDGLVPVPHVLAYHSLFFAFGALMYGRGGGDGGQLVDWVGRPWWLWLGATTLVVFPAGLTFTFGPEVFSWPVASVLQVTYAWGMCLGLIGMFRVFFAVERRGVRYLSDASYWLYLAHLPVVIVAQVVMRDQPLPALVKFSTICFGVTVLLLACYQLFVRYTPVGTLLNGPRQLRAHDAT